MSNGAKIGLGLAGVAAAYLLYRKFSSSAAGIAVGALPAPVASPLGPSPGAITPATVASSAGSAVGKYGATAVLTAALGPLGLLTTSTGRTILSTGASAVGGVVKGAGGAVVSGAKAIGSAASSVAHDIFSVF
jgi:hypothetical protein